MDVAALISGIGSAIGGILQGAATLNTSVNNAKLQNWYAKQQQSGTNAGTGDGSQAEASGTGAASVALYGGLAVVFLLVMYLLLK